MPPKMSPRLRFLRQQLRNAANRWRKQKARVRKAEAKARQERLDWRMETELFLGRKEELMAEFPDADISDIMPQSDASSSDSED